MIQRPTSYRNLWALTILCLLYERPMHPYEMQRLIRARKKDDYLDLKRGSVYHAITRLQRARLIEAVETRREGRRPERTVYRLTEAGEQELRTWLGELLAKPVREANSFFAAVSLLACLPPADVLDQLQDRVGLLEAEIAGLNAALAALTPKLGRLVLLEIEYALALWQAELAWVRSVIDDLRTGQLNWDPEVLRQGGLPPGVPGEAGGEDQGPR
jgi:DNA-binding PadR family transcriptional regulator